MLEAALRAIGGLAAPPSCAACGCACAETEVVCHACTTALMVPRAVLEPGPPGVDLACAAAPYEGVVRKVVVGLKFGPRLTLAAVAAAAIERACPSEHLQGTIVPVPAAPLRWRWRGFDPAEEIGLALSKAAGLEFDSCLGRRQGPRQMGRPRRERLADAPAVHLAGLAPSRALLVDDVHTTGATLAAAAAALKAGGCGGVVALTVARA